MNATNRATRVTNELPWSYSEPIRVVEMVGLKVPNRGDYMNFAEAHDFETANGTKEIPDRWLCRSTYAGSRTDFIVFRRNYYNISERDLGKKITATVVVRERTNGKVTETFLDITKIGEILANRPSFDLKISEDGEGIAIKGARKMNICFIPRAPYIPREKENEQ